VRVREDWRNGALLTRAFPGSQEGVGNDEGRWGSCSDLAAYQKGKRQKTEGAEVGIRQGTGLTHPLRLRGETGGEGSGLEEDEGGRG